MKIIHLNYYIKNRKSIRKYKDKTADKKIISNVINIKKYL